MTGLLSLPLLALAAAQRTPPVTVPPPPLRYPVYAPPAPPPPPPPPPSWPYARPPVHRSGTIMSDDYPEAAIRAHEEGSVTAEMTVGADGRVTHCRVLRSSGSAVLDSTTCVLVTRRFRFSPALDDRGRPVTGTATRTVRWELPDDALPAPFVDGWAAVWVPAIPRGTTRVRCAEAASTPDLTQVAADLCFEFLPPEGPAAQYARPARRALLSISGAGGAPPPPTPPVEGRLVYREQAEFEVGADGTVSGCRTAVTASLWREEEFGLCRYLDTTDGPFFAAPAPAPALVPATPPRQGRIRLEVYE